MTEIRYKRADSTEELNQILELQSINIPSSISKNELKTQGFVTVHHDFEILKSMNDKCPHIIAKSDKKVVGYALCMLKEFKEKIEVLKPMFKHIDNCLKQNDAYIVMGQVCIDKAFRKQGMFRGLYYYMKLQLQAEFDMIVTEVDVANTKSLDAHYAIGFKTIYSYRSTQQDWEILYWKLNN
ncbi:MAG: N-acetyltransferase [Bacteroidetes bacterium]|nr:MAG: N-acetyltransferase [Bacteroidota bacterium]